MDRKEAKIFLPIIQAFVEGKQIQYLDDWGFWGDMNDNIAFDDIPSRYRIKPEPKYRPFRTQEECWEEMHKHPDFGWIMDDGVIRQVLKVGRDKIYYLEYGYKRTGTTYSSFEESCLSLKFTDGTPFGIKEE